MATTLSAASAATASGTFSVTAGTPKKITIFPQTGDRLDPAVKCHVYDVTPGGDVHLYTLTCNDPARVVDAEGNYKYLKEGNANAYGVVSNP